MKEINEILSQPRYKEINEFAKLKQTNPLNILLWIMAPRSSMINFLIRTTRKLIDINKRLERIKNPDERKTVLKEYVRIRKDLLKQQLKYEDSIHKKMERIEKMQDIISNIDSNDPKYKEEMMKLDKLQAQLEKNKQTLDKFEKRNGIDWLSNHTF
jgi:predicted nuclease with TOPRIM domain